MDKKRFPSHERAKERYHTDEAFKVRKKELAKQAKARAKVKARAFVEEYKKGKSCVKCGYSDVRCLDFHHVNRENKISSIPRLVTDGRAVKVIKAEIAKCILLCANCHRIEHWDELKAGLNKKINNSPQKYTN